MRDDPNVTLATDKEAGHIVAFATPPQQATIRATIDQMQKEVAQVDVIALTNTDPQVAVLAINKLFGSLDDKPDPKAPRVDADLNSRSLLVRGTASQVEQIRDLLRQLGETEEGERRPGIASQQHVRLLPLTGAAARSAVEQIEQIWPSVRPNRIRILASERDDPHLPAQRIERGTAWSKRLRAASPPDDSAGEFQQMLELLREDNAANRDLPDATKFPTGADARKNIFRYAAEDVQTAPANAGQGIPSEVTSPSPQPPAPSPAAKAPNAAPRSSSLPAPAACSSPPTTLKRSTSSKRCSPPSPGAMRPPPASTRCFT